MSKMTEISRFSSSGKTFFFNRGEAENGSPFLAVNALFGKGQQQRVVLFPPHYLQFREHLSRAIEVLYGLKFTDNTVSQEKISLPSSCPKCGVGCGEFSVMVYEPTRWLIDCNQCGTEIYNTEVPNG